MEHAGLRRAEFGVPGELRDRLVAAILAGEKTATTGLLREWELEDEPLPTPGERFLVVDSDDRPVAVIETVQAYVLPLGAADDALAHDEGEGFRCVADWRAAHERFWREEVLPALPAGHGITLADDEPLVVERFRLVERL